MGKIGYHHQRTLLSAGANRAFGRVGLGLLSKKGVKVLHVKVSANHASTDEYFNIHGITFKDPTGTPAGYHYAFTAQAKVRFEASYNKPFIVPYERPWLQVNIKRLSYANSHFYLEIIYEVLE